MPAKRKSPRDTTSEHLEYTPIYRDNSSKVHSVQFVSVAVRHFSGYGTFDPTPLRSTPGAAAFDLKSSMFHILCPGKTEKISVGFRMQMPPELYAEIKGRSGLAAKAIMCHNGVIDSDYRGEVCVILHNASEETFDIKRGDRVAQMVFHRVESVQFEHVEELTRTERGEGGFGSTGV